SEIKHAFEIDHGFLVAGKIERRDSGNAVETAEPRHADVEFRAGCGIHRIEQDQRHRKRDDAEIHVADAPVEDEITEQGSEGSRRISTMAAASSATSPNTGVVAKVAIWLIVPNSAEAETVPLRMAAPPPITVMKDLAT